MAGQTSVEGKQVLFATEAELFIEQLKTYPVKEIGSAKWMNQHEFIEKLNMQAIISASSQTDEFVKELLITLEKIPTYFFFHKEACEAAGDSILDLTDYCLRRITLLIAMHEEEVEDKEETSTRNDFSSVEELKMQERTIFFTVCIKCVSVLRYIIDSLTCLPLNVMTRVLNTHNTPVILVQLIENPPWIKRSKGKLMKFIDNQWKVISKNERLLLTKTDGQVWLAVYQLLMNEDCQRKYEFNSYSKEQILKLRGYMNEVLLDQIPSLMDLQRYLEQLAIMEPPAIKKDIILEQVSFPFWLHLSQLRLKRGSKDTARYQNDTSRSLTSVIKIHSCPMCPEFPLWHEEEVEDKEETSTRNGFSSVEELKVQERTIFFTVCIKCVSVLRYIIDSLTCLPLNVMTRLLNTHNTPVILVQLIENPPWIKRSKGKLIKFIDNQWKVISKNERLLLTKTDGQVWLAVYQLLMNEDCQRKYEFNSYSKEQILKLRGYMNEVLLDQIPSLMDLQRYLEQLAIMEPPAIKKDIILEQVPVLWKVSLGFYYCIIFMGFITRNEHQCADSTALMKVF
ncbi:PREDICTED: LOW QUALITY PROTEIN: zinc finger MYND domain-containing protein 10-like [Acropora digitifera]|uniref:LOW QUALITY PROTEIN: zinc finger MYND domain-containing protein 10-like n=1 Tax=Acropora digitifera TaxID=70779 RepID=UPI00077AB437|nr:PREDICTED: LOW QUALITY PROTEIN: zinc finger MYND domain-containing protein 10-like [Acropora digitifera]